MPKVYHRRIAEVFQHPARAVVGQRGLTLVELAIVLAIVGVLAAVVVPNVGGFLGKGSKQSFDADRQTLQTASDSFRTDASNIPKAFSTIGALSAATTDDCTGGKGAGTPGTGCNPYIDIAALVDGANVDQSVDGSKEVAGGLLANTDSVKSADPAKNVGATNSPAGSYGWYIDANGQVRSDPTFTDAGEVYP